MNTKIIILAGTIVVAVAAFLFVKSNNFSFNVINDFEECAEAGHPVMESYPRQCKTPEGKIFREEIETENCSEDGSCPGGFYCQSGRCEKFIMDQSCLRKEDCVLIDKSLNFDCCLENLCALPDYSSDNWLAVNTDWFNGRREEYCATESSCGKTLDCKAESRCPEAPVCSPEQINAGFEAECVNNGCQKMVKPKKTDKKEDGICVDSCGDGICQEIVCQGSGCPCAETAQSCPDDCAR